MDPKERIIVALDVTTQVEAEALIEQLKPYCGCFKIGLQLMTRIGVPSAVEMVRHLGGRVFLDGKFSDIPNTVGEASAAVAALGVQMFTVHASAGIEAMRAAIKNKGTAKVLAVTVLTSLSDNDSQSIFGAYANAKVLQFARDAKLAGVDGVICSPQELGLFGRHEELRGLIKVTPGVRPIWAVSGDQSRITTPSQAIMAGAAALVIGRPITNPPKEVGTPAKAVKRILEEIISVTEGGEAE